MKEATLVSHPGHAVVAHTFNPKLVSHNDSVVVVHALFSALERNIKLAETDLRLILNRRIRGGRIVHFCSEIEVKVSDSCFAFLIFG